MNVQYLCSFLLVVVTVVLAEHEPNIESQSPGKEIIEDGGSLTDERGYQGSNVVLNEGDRSKTREERSMLAIEQPPISNIYRLSHFGKVNEEVQTENSTNEWAQSDVEYYANLMRLLNLFQKAESSESSSRIIKQNYFADLFGPLDQPEPSKSEEVIAGFEPQEFSESDLKEVYEHEVAMDPKKMTKEFTAFPAIPLITAKPSVKESNEQTSSEAEVDVPSTDYKPPVDVPSTDYKPPVDVPSTDYKPPVDVPSTDYKPPVDVSSADLPVESRTDENAQDDVKDPLSAGSIRGIPGVHFPDYEEIPMSSFECTDQQYFPGFYADMETGCQVFHVCYQERRESFLCPVGTIFNQAILTCDNWYSSNCSFTPSFYSSNAGIGAETTPDSPLDQSNVSTEGSSTQGPTTESYSSESPSEGEYYHFGGIHPFHSKRISPEKFFELFTKFFPVKVKVTVFPVTKETKIVAVASVGDRKNKHPTQQPGKTPHPTRPQRPRPTTKRWNPPTKRPYPTRKTRPTRRHYPKTTTTRKTYTTTTRKPYTTTTTHKPYTTTTTYKPHTTTTRKPYTTTTTYKPRTTTTQKPYKPPTTRRPHTTTTRRPYYPTTRRPYSTTSRPYYPPTRDPYQRGIDPSVNKDVSDAFEIARRILEHVGHMFPRGDGSYHPSEGSYPDGGSSSYPNEGSSYPNEGSSYPNEGSSYPSESSSYPSHGSSRSCPCVDSRGNPSWCSCEIESNPIRWCRCYDKHGHMRRCPCSVHPRWCPCVDSHGHRTRCPCRYPRVDDVPPSDHLTGEKNCTETAPGHDHGQGPDYGGYKDNSSHEGLRVRSYKPLVQLNPRFIVKPVFYG